MRTALLRVATTAAAALAALAIGTATASTASAATAAADPVFTPTGDVTAQVTKLSQSDAASRLRSSGITWSSSGGCTDRYNSTCTSFEQINLATVQGAQTLKSATGCALNITGGTEVGHASGTYSHFNGYKLDFSLSTCLTNYIKGTFTSIGGSKWQSGSGNVYYLESNHWDVTYYNCGGC
ncbi:hypothetical protein [Actinokineospora bangkokensis]|uniref:Peptidoglycan-binding protein n=1 Tax=Actinokineospora bangkokensis TaxID=1193682 RepID=A0A1Q9LRE6_9PSEU|nr:hypothetical protein [Actinokineospora bangkokensis]OLR94592.1 hypothetical protein BJP25_12720 [Actinokineospora bangkokensis]